MLSHPRRIGRRVATALVFVSGCLIAHAVDFTDGLTTAVPVKEGRAPTIDGDLSDWDLSAAEPVYISEQTIERMNSEWAFMYDDEALYVAVRAATPGRPYTNRNNPQDAFWARSDIVQFRIAADPALPRPLDRNRDRASNRTAHVSLWKNTITGSAFVHVNRGLWFDKGSEVNPEGAQVAFATGEETGFIAELRLPWSALNAPDGRNPFKPGERAQFVMESIWIGGDATRVAAGFARDPGTFAFNRPSHWGQLEFAPKSLGERRRPEMAALIDEARSRLAKAAEGVGAPIVIDVPEDGLKLSLNILGSKGEVVRELAGGLPVSKGPMTLRWDGRDAWGRAVEPGTHRWGAYLHRGLRAEYAGAVGSSGRPAYNTQDGRGAWGGDHSNPVDAASDESGVYLLWPVSEAGRALVKLDHAGNVVWRVNPFVGGGFGPFRGVASDGNYVYLVRGGDMSGVYFLRIDAATGALQTWSEGGAAEVKVHDTTPATVPVGATSITIYGKNINPPEGRAYQADACGFVVRDGRAYVSSFAGDRIHILNTETGEKTGELSVRRPMGLAFDAAGNLHAVSYREEGGSGVVKFAGVTGEPAPLVTEGLDAPHGLAVGPDDRVYVSDAGASHQIKVFSSDGKRVATWGKPGGRAWQGRYDGEAFLKPAGLSLDGKGGLLVAESSTPRVFSRLALDDGRLLDRWFGAGDYWNAAWPMPDDPLHVFYMLGEAIGRGRVTGPEQGGPPDAYWDLARAGYPHAGNIQSGIPHPEIVKGPNGRSYLVHDARQHGIHVFEPDETLRPVALWRMVRARTAGNPLGRDHLHVWIDADGDGRIQESEETRLDKLADGSPMPSLSETTSSMHMRANGDLYFMSGANRIVRVPAVGFEPDGRIRWDVGAATLAVPEVLPGAPSLHTTYRSGVLGVRLDSEDNLYTVFNAVVPGKREAFDYPNPEIAARMRPGMGHTASFNAVKFAKFDRGGRLLWMAGRKATAGEKPGELYHFWNMAGLVNDRYVAGASEWGRIYLYTHDGFYVDALMNNPGEAPAPGPYTFGGETSGGRVQYFPKRGELWAYSTGGAYRVHGFSQGRVEGERRLDGEIVLDRVYELASVEAQKAGPMRMVRLSGDPLKNAAIWNSAPVSTLRRGDGSELAKAQLGYDAKRLYGRITVVDDSPLDNVSADLQLAFKGGDTAGFVLGPAREAKQPGAGDVRLMVAAIGGKARVIGMKAATNGAKRPFEYTTPAAGTAAFAFVAEVPAARVETERTANGYVAVFSVPREFLEFDLAPGVALRGDVEVRLSGAGQRGIQAVSRNYLFTPATASTTMTDDIPTEARMYPEFWDKVEVE